MRPNYFTKSIILKYFQNLHWVVICWDKYCSILQIVFLFAIFLGCPSAASKLKWYNTKVFFCVISQTVHSRWRRRSSNKEFMRCSAAVTVSWHHCVMGVTRYGTSNIQQLPLVFIGSSVKKARHGKLFAVGKNEVRFKTSRLSGFKNWVPNLQQR